ncbi:hypothetical protein ACFWIN_15050 [Streptomyces sp. NPDC127049]|uniref:hypothetical protein n=1 Tax=Streptomyces sp. NPDC127049 TaxID=3347118 RepID=UPI00364FF9F6
MADERYQWLDPEAAERLFRGEPVDAVDPSDRARADALADALAAARTAAAPAPGVPLAGEEAALAAFRTATAARAAAPAPARDQDPAHSADLGRVRLTSVPRPVRRWGRSLRYGLATALAAVTVGGVAVAASTGVLPLVDQEPSRTVTAAETATPPEPSGSGGSSRPTPAIERDEDPSRSTDPGTPAGTTAPGTSPAARPDTTTATPRPGVTSPEQDRPERGPTAPTATSGAGDDARRGPIAACREYRSGRLDATTRERLSRLLRNEEPLRAYCDRLLAGATDKGDTGSSGSGSSGSGSGSDSGSGSGGEQDGDAKNGDKDREKDGDTRREEGDAGDRNRPDLSYGIVPAPADTGREHGQDSPDPEDGPRDRTWRGGTVDRTLVTALALCPVGAPETGV